MRIMRSLHDCKEELRTMKHCLRFLAGLLLCTSLFAQDSAAPGNPRAILHTSMGDISLELFADKSPLTVENFVRYATSGFYDGTIFHRVIADFMIQGGGFTSDMQRKPTAEPITNEANNGLSNVRGTIAMARSGQPHSATSQFFINVRDNQNLDYTGQSSPGTWGYAVFGKVVDGMDVVDAIRVVETTATPPHADVPKTPVVIESVEVIPATAN
jgi:cyclophilin family peptidyl-prolyl cis-trans isomerase